jgi:TetR/AcrR family transcriptional regulator, regulator of cefoperazone and chloramphenicol sensitivity
MPVHDDTQQRLIEAAGQVFAAKGYEGATVRDICQQAGVNIAAVNYYFRDKERLYIESVKAACDRQTKQIPLPDWPPGTPPLVRLCDFIRTLANRMLGEQDVHWPRQLFLREMAQPTAACAELVRDHIRPMCELLSGILGELLPEVPEAKRRLIGFSMVGQCVFYRVASPIVALLVGDEEYRTYDAKMLAEHITKFSLAALGFEKPSRTPPRGNTRRRKAARPTRS